MNSPDRLRALLAEPGLVVMPAVWDGLSAKLAAGAGFKTAFLSGSCVAASRLGGPDLDLISFGEMFDSFNMVHAAAPQTLVLADGDHGYGNPMNVQRTVRAYGRAGAAAVLIEVDVHRPDAVEDLVGHPLLLVPAGVGVDREGHRLAVLDRHLGKPHPLPAADVR